MTNQEIILQTLNQWRQQIQSNLQSTGTNASGETSKSLEVVQESNGDITKLVGRGYFGVVETGRKPGKRPPQSKILEWVNIKFPSIVNEYQKRGLAYIIAKRIGETGSKLYRDGCRNDIYSNVITDENIKKLMERIAVNVFYDLSTTIDGTIKTIQK